MQLNIKLSPNAVTPTYATEHSAGADIYSAEDVIIPPHDTRLIPTGISLEIPAGYWGMIVPRSGLSLKTPLRQPNSVGVIDADYRGEIRGMFTNMSDETIHIDKGTRFGQLLILPYIRADFTPVTELTDTERGVGGFGSTGTK